MPGLLETPDGMFGTSKVRLCTSFIAVHTCAWSALRHRQRTKSSWDPVPYILFIQINQAHVLLSYTVARSTSTLRGILHLASTVFYTCGMQQCLSTEVA